MNDIYLPTSPTSPHPLRPIDGNEIEFEEANSDFEDVSDISSVATGTEDSLGRRKKPSEEAIAALMANVKVRNAELEAEACQLNDREQAAIDAMLAPGADADSKSKWRIKNQKIFLTYKTHIDKDAMRLFLGDIKGKGIKTFYMAHENGLNDPKTPYEHSHVVVDFGFVFDSTYARVFDFEGIHPHISFIKDIWSWKAACKYISKEDKTVLLMPKDEFRIKGKLDVSGVWEHTTLQDALSECGNLNEVMPTIALYNARPKKRREIKLPFNSVAEMNPAQRFIWSLLQEESDDRRVKWFGDAYGSSGKTKLMVWAVRNYPDKCHWGGPGMSVENQMMLFAQRIDEGWDGDVLFINLTRSKSEQSDMAHLYTFIENVKDGIICFGKFRGGMELINPPHVVIFANVFPDVRTMSHDRFEVYEITRSKFVERVPIEELWNPAWGRMETYFERRSGLRRFREKAPSVVAEGWVEQVCSTHNPCNIKKEGVMGRISPVAAPPAGGLAINTDDERRKRISSSLARIRSLAKGSRSEADS